jgi:ABC-type lipoprotein export system ATPase subunit
MSDAPLLVARGLVKRYRRDATADPPPALVDADLTVLAGEFVALVGPSGSGKSTLLQLLGGLDAPDSGSVSLDGSDYARLDDDALTRLRHRDLGFVFQFFNLMPTLTARENAMFPALLGGLPRTEARRRADALLAEVGLDGLGDRYPDELSGGQQQRVATARALVNGPRVVLADEPTGSLDRAAGRDVLDVLGRLARERRVAVVMATHDPEAAARADRVVRLRDGRIEP